MDTTAVSQAQHSAHLNVSHIESLGVCGFAAVRELVREFALATKPFSMAICAQCDQIALGIYAAAASKCFVVYLQLRHSATILASPPITLKDLLVQRAIASRIYVSTCGAGRGSRVPRMGRQGQNDGLLTAFAVLRMPTSC